MKFTRAGKTGSAILITEAQYQGHGIKNIRGYGLIPQPKTYYNYLLSFKSYPANTDGLLFFIDTRDTRHLLFFIDIPDTRHLLFFIK